MQGLTAGQGMVFVLSVLNRVYDFVRVCPKQVCTISCVYITRCIISWESVLITNRVLSDAGLI